MAERDDTAVDNSAVDRAKVYAEKYQKPRGGKLADYLKEGPLRPAEEKLLHHTCRGTRCTIGDGSRPSHRTKENEIRASFLRYLILGGCDQVSLHRRGIDLEGGFICDGETPYGPGLDLEGAKIDQDLGLFRCHIEGQIIFYGAFTQTIILDGSKCDGIRGDGLETKGSVFLRNGFHSSGAVRLLGAKLGGNLECDNSRFEGTPYSLSCDGLEGKGNISLCNGFHASGAVILPGAKLGGDLTCSNGNFKSDITADNITIGGALWLSKGFQLHGCLRLPNAIISGTVHCKAGYAHSKNIAIRANGTEIGGSVELGGFNSAGTISFQNALIKGNFSCEGATLSSKPCLELRDSKVEGNFVWRGIKHAGGRLDLGGASAKVINFELKSWLMPSEVKLNNFEYQGFTNLEEEADSHYWLQFLKQQPKADLTHKFRPGPWDQLANVLEKMGYESEARSMRIRKENRLTGFIAQFEPAAQTHFRLMHKLNVVWRRIYGPLTGHGYQPGRVMFLLAGLIGLGWAAYWHAAINHIMTPTHPLIFKEANAQGAIPKHCNLNWVYFVDDTPAYRLKHAIKDKDRCRRKVPSEYSEFSPLVYAADMVLPIVNLRQQDDWAPRVVDTQGNRDWHGYGIRAFEWLLIGLGWGLSLVFVSAVGGIIRR